MPHPFLFAGVGASFTVRHVVFTIERDGLTVDGAPVTIQNFILFALGEIDAPIPPEPELPTIAETVLAVSGDSGFDDDAGDFDILREALAATGLTDAVADETADLTVFAPTDAAFIQLARDLGADIADGDEAGALAAIIAATAELAGGAEEGLALVKNILLYHVAPEGRTLEELQGEVQGLFGPGVTVDGTTVIDAEPDISDPTVVGADIVASNGVIQAIDRVLLPIDLPGDEPEPEPLDNIVDIAAGSPDFEILVKALTATNLVETVRGLEDATVFAPTDAAFAALAVDLGFQGEQEDEDAVFDFLVSALTDLGGGDPVPLLTDILLYHVSPGAKTAAEIDAAETIATVNGATFATEGTELIDNEPDVANPTIVIPDIAADNGTVQAIDRVLLPIDIPGNEETKLVGGRGDDVIESSDRSSLIVGRNGDDDLSGGRGDETVFGGRGDDTLSGGEGDDLLNGGAGRDAILGGGGDDLLRGQKGADDLNGGAGDDTIIGGRGADTLTGGEGDDLLNGGRGADRFDFVELSGHDKVVRLQNNDTLVFSTDDFADFAELLDAIDAHSGGSTIETADGAVTLAFRAIDADDSHLFEFV
ncbi:MAG: fasciclin domain-containing protein [Pseudomonadota bacterium]